MVHVTRIGSDLSSERVFPKAICKLIAVAFVQLQGNRTAEKEVPGLDRSLKVILR